MNGHRIFARCVLSAVLVKDVFFPIVRDEAAEGKSE